MTQLVEDLVDVTKIQRGELTLHKASFFVKEMLLDCIEQVQDDQHAIELRLPDDFSLYADRHRIEQVLINLLTNAIKYSPGSERIICKVATDGVIVRFSVQDFGIGIPADKINRVFDRFYRVEKDSRNFSGMGLGLFISKNIVTKHGGRIGVVSIEGKGSKFWFELPLKELEETTASTINLTLSQA